MSTTTGYVINRDGIVRPDREWRNAWHGAFALWGFLARTYLDSRSSADAADGMLPSDRLMLSREVQADLWALADDSAVPLCLRVAELTTFDRVIVRREDFAAVADALTEAHALLVAEGRSSHLDAQAEWLRSHSENSAVQGAAWQQTSVADDLWERSTDDDASRPYDINRDTGHWFLELPAT